MNTKQKIEVGKATINNNAVGSWLEPYIGYKVDVVKISKDFLWFKWDSGNIQPSVEKHDRHLFTIQTT